MYDNIEIIIEEEEEYMKTNFLFTIMLLIFAAIMVTPASAEEVTITFDEGRVQEGREIGNAYSDLGVTFVGATVVDTNGNGNLGFVPTGSVCTINFSPYVTSVSIDFENADVGIMEGILVNGQKIYDIGSCFWQGNTLHIESNNENPIKSVKLPDTNLWPCMKIQFDNLRYDQIPEFPTIALPVAALIGMMCIFQSRKD